MATQSAVDVSSWTIYGTEPAGDDEKCWLEDPDGLRWLFKPRTEKDGRTQGEDWAEVGAACAARLLRVPHAPAVLAVRDGRNGVISADLKHGWELQPGGLALAAVVPGYEPSEPRRPKNRLGHNLQNIQLALADRDVPFGAEVPPGFTSFGVFTGFLLLDALVANPDRHDENWAVLRAPEAEMERLAGSFDHASSLGFNLLDRHRDALLSSGDLEAWARRGLARRFEFDPRARPMTLVELARRALTRVSASERTHWLTRIEQFDVTQFGESVSRISRMSHLARMFAVALVETNRRRLLDVCADDSLD